MTHTPGTWSFQELRGPRDYTCKRTHWAVGQAHGAKTGIGLVFGGDQDPPTEANARLIAAAPDLLRTLIATVKALDELRSETIAQQFMEAEGPGSDGVDGSFLDAAAAEIKQARAAIQKATGEKP